jgi:hypothetical protein
VAIMAPFLGALIAQVLPDLLDRVLPEDPVKAGEAKLKLLELAQKGDLATLDAEVRLALGQMEVNKEEAKSDSLFKSGWRPAAGWAGVSGLFYQFLIRPVFGWCAENLWGWTTPPSLEVETLMTLLFGLLGLGAYRTVEKIKGAK